MLGQPLRRLIALLAAGCHPAPAPDPVDPTTTARRYVEDAAFRRRTLEASLVNPANGYSALRWAKYDEAGWGALPEWQPELAPPVAWEEAALIEAGRRAFFEYPMRIAPFLNGSGGQGEVPGGHGLQAVVRTDTPDGMHPALTCATCHARSDGAGGLTPGPTNDRLDYGALLDDIYGQRTPMSEWGPGRIDVTPDSLDNATAITDLRPVRHQTHLHRAASVRNGLVELAIRTETLIITSLGQAARPPRQVAVALALFLRSLADELPPVPLDHPGGAVFEEHCEPCHGGEGLTGPPTPLGEVGTDPAVGASPDRTTGAYRTPSLRGVGDRRPLLSDGAVPDLPTLLSPDRDAPGHPYGQGLDADRRAALLDFLNAL